MMADGSPAADEAAGVGVVAAAVGAIASSLSIEGGVKRRLL